MPVLELLDAWKALLRKDASAQAMDVFPEPEWSAVVARKVVENIKEWVRMAYSASVLRTDDAMEEDLLSALGLPASAGSGNHTSRVEASEAALLAHVDELCKSKTREAVEFTILRLTTWIAKGITLRLASCSEADLTAPLQALHAQIAYEGLDSLGEEGKTRLLSRVKGHVDM